MQKTSRPKIEEELAERNRELEMTKTVLELERVRLRTLLESIGDGVCVIGRNWTITLWNAAAEKITGWTAREVLGRPFREAVKSLNEQDRKDNIAFIEEAMLYGEPRFAEEKTILVSKDGRDVPVSESAAPVFDERKKVAGAVIIFRDISKEKEAQLLRSDFAYASHQLRTPVGRSMWLLESLLEERDPEALKQGVETAYLSMKSIQKLMGQLMEVSEIDQGVIIPKTQMIKLADVFAEIIDFVRTEASKNNVSVTLTVDPAAVMTVDPKLLKKILAEILDNAVLYNRPGGEIKVNAAGQNGGILVEIRDTGIGIPEDEQVLVFNKFFRGTNFDTTLIVGAGLGLYITHSYVKLLKGKIWFDSEEGKGTTFSFFLPVS